MSRAGRLGTRWHLTWQKQTVSGGHGKQTRSSGGSAPPRRRRGNRSAAGANRAEIKGACDQRFQVSAAAISRQGCRKEQRTQPRGRVGEAGTTQHPSFSRNSSSLSMNRTAALGGAPRLSNAPRRHRAEITRGLASFQASLALSRVSEGKASAVSFAKLAT